MGIGLRRHIHGCGPTGPLGPGGRHRGTRLGRPSSAMLQARAFANLSDDHAQDGDRSLGVLSQLYFASLPGRARLAAHRSVLSEYLNRRLLYYVE